MEIKTHPTVDLGIIGADTTIKYGVWRKPNTYIWRPLGNITIYELALCLPLLLGKVSWIDEEYDSLLPDAKRHFVKKANDE